MGGHDSVERRTGDGGAYQAVLSLARELWVLRDRQRVLEAVLARRGVFAADEIAAYVPTDTERAELERECRAFVASLFPQLDEDAR